MSFEALVVLVVVLGLLCVLLVLSDVGARVLPRVDRALDRALGGDRR